MPDSLRAPVVERAAPDAAFGVGYAVLAYLSWGLLPLYWKAVSWVPALQLVMYRMLWALPVLLAVLAWRGRLAELGRLTCQPRRLRVLMLTALLVGSNWLIFVWAVEHDHVVEASLGYFILPLLYVLLGLVFLHERLRPLQWLAVGLAGLGVLWQIVMLGVIPWISLALAATFGFYGLLRKTAPVDGLLGLAAEMVLLAPLALSYLIWSGVDGSHRFSQHGSGGMLLIALSGLLTVLPLWWFANAARRLRLATIGFFQYLAPTCQLLLAVLVFAEPFTSGRLISFGFIWLALALYSWDLSGDLRRRQGATTSPRTVAR